jgi:hypothetical protein
VPIGLDAYGRIQFGGFRKTDYNPAISNNESTGIDETTLLVEWDGLFNMVDIQCMTFPAPFGIAHDD